MKSILEMLTEDTKLEMPLCNLHIWEKVSTKEEDLRTICIDVIVLWSLIHMSQHEQKKIIMGNKIIDKLWICQLRMYKMILFLK